MEMFSCEWAAGAGPSWYLGGESMVGEPGERFDQITVFHVFGHVFGQKGLRKQCRPRSDAAELFVTPPAILHTLTSSKMDLFKKKYKVKSEGIEYLV